MCKVNYTDNNGRIFQANELLPCPFCGGDPVMLFIGNSHTKSRKVEIKCKNCHVKRIDATIMHTHDWIAYCAINNWNQRTNK